MSSLTTRNSSRSSCKLTQASGLYARCRGRHAVEPHQSAGGPQDRVRIALDGQSDERLPRTLTTSRLTRTATRATPVSSR
ncbi:hypothetical protein BG844_38165 [Couchioplanes caeruleus subsp. caeruleus]|uniref:Uncharacterized protein n=1 Tax=Couchioplanes caeruleus subsp. caeruleus TaxID=56427 RepID=A0A1K0F9C4_9ACTN|nr:hypothetical protein BG844_38165 [Couchioplanes caeruleus subsp. caeruleus]